MTKAHLNLFQTTRISPVAARRNRKKAMAQEHWKMGNTNTPIAGLKACPRRRASDWHQAKADKLTRLSLREALYSESQATEIFLSLMMLSIGLYVALPFPVLGGTLGLLSRNVSEPLCAAWMGGLGAVRLLAIFNRRWLIRLGAAGCSLFTWLLLFWLTIGRDPHSTGTVIFLMLAGQSFWVLLRMSDKGNECA